MSISLLQELRLVLDADPSSLRSDQLMDEVFWDALDLLTTPNRDQLAQEATANAGLAREVFSRSEPGPSSWRLWYAGQLQGVAGVLRALLGRQLALGTSALLHSRKHALTILEALDEEDSRVSDLARRVNLDESHLGREVKVLVRHNLVETVKEGRERWARITVAGRRALAEVLNDATLERDQNSLRDVYEDPWSDISFPLADEAYSIEQQQQFDPAMLSYEH